MSIWWEKMVEVLGGILGQSFVNAWRNNSAVDSDIESLRSALLKAHLLIERSECWRLPKYYPIDELLPKLKDAVFEAESLVNEFGYQGLKKSLPGTSFLNNWMTKFPAAVKVAIDRLDKISKDMEKECARHNIPENPNKFSETARPKTTTSLYTTNTFHVYGREKELDELFSLMGVPRSGQTSIEELFNLDIGESSDSRNKKGNISVLSIVGMGGVGKTALAQMFCNLKSVKSYFDLIIWVCVSDNFDSVRLTKEIIEDASRKGCDLTTNNLNTLETKLDEILNSKRFLLVLDDVWSKDWQRLLGPMKGASKGSIVMVTTRSYKFVEVAGTNIDSRGVINLEGLEKEIYWNFFKSFAFGSAANSDTYPKLESIGKEICSRLKGSPLAAKTIGGLLGTNMDATHWMDIKNSKIWELKQEEHDILPVLQLSYQYLPSHLKKCFSYCALYPKDFKFTKWELTKLWIMQGFINLSQQLEVHWEEPFVSKAEGYFLDLIQRCFFQEAAGSESGEYVIHDLMHDVCQSITKDECFCLEDTDLKNNVAIPNIRHLSVFRKVTEVQEQINKLCKYKKLLSVRVGPHSSCGINDISNWCKELTSIRSLSLSRCEICKLPESIGNLKHLQYLDISFTHIEMLPQSFCYLYHLVYLDMEGCSRIRHIPKGFNKLVNLRFLYWPVDMLILLGHTENLAKEIEKANMSFFVSNDIKIENLKYLNKLSGYLKIHMLGNVPNKEAAEEAHLKNKSSVTELYLYWRVPCYDQSFVDECHDEDVIQGLCPHPNLKVLEIDGYGGITFPSWFKKDFLPNLTEIHIAHCKQLTNLQDCLEPIHFPMLKRINIILCEKLVSLPVESFGGFVSLEELKILTCPKLTCSKAMVLPPSIRYLQLESCGEVEKSIPSCLRDLISLETLVMQNCSELISIPAEEVSNLKSLKKLTIENCARLQSLGVLKFLVSLEKLHILNCPDFVSISTDEAGNLKSLKKLEIESCAKFQSLGGLKCLASLEELTICKCPNLVSIPAEDASNLKSLLRLNIRNCAGLQSLAGLKFLASLEFLSIDGCPKLAETGGQDIFGKLPSELLAKLPSESRSGPETLEERRVKRARN